MVCKIFGAGEYYGEIPAKKSGDFFIAADGGYSRLIQANITPDLTVGDFDSLKKLPDGQNVIVLPREKDETDTAAALRIGWERGFRIFHIYGGTGGRIDHTLANIQCLSDIVQKGGRAYLFDRNSVITAIHNDEVFFSEKARGIISAFAHGEEAHGVFEQGLKYPLDNVTLKNTIPLGISNEFIGKPSRVSVREGTLILVYPKTLV